MTEIDVKWQAYLDTLGANAGFVEGLIHQYIEDPAQVDERWRRIFDEVAQGRIYASGKPEVAAAAKTVPPQPPAHAVSDQVLPVQVGLHKLPPAPGG